MQMQVDKLNKSFGKKHVLKDVSFAARSGVALGLLGRNGAGKSTTLRIIMDLFPADSGSVTIDGKPSKKLLGKIGFLPEERGLYPKRLVSEQMTYFGELKGMSANKAKERAMFLLKKLEAEEYYKKTLSTLSKGNQQKIQLAIALINDPDVVILDEPFSGLDPVNAKLLKTLVAELARQGKVVLFSSHQMGYVEEFCDEICIINEGQIIISGNLKQMKKNYPRDRVILYPEDGDLAGLENMVRGLSFAITDIKRTTGGCIVKLKDEADKTLLFRETAASGIRLDSFMVVEPTLEEIFVEKCGSEAKEGTENDATV